MLRLSAGGAVTPTVAVALAVVAWSALSANDADVCRVPDAEDEISTVAVTSASGVPAVIGASVEVQVSTVLPPLSAQLHPVAVGAAAKVSPDGRVAVRTGSWYAGPAGEPPSDGTKVRGYVVPAAAPDGVPEVERWRTGSGVTVKLVVACEPW